MHGTNSGSVARGWRCQWRMSSIGAWKNELAKNTNSFVLVDTVGLVVDDPDIVARGRRINADFRRAKVDDKFAAVC